MSNIVVFGMGKTGRSLAKLLQNANNLWLFDDDPIKSSLRICDIPFDIIDEVIVSPGVKPDNQSLKIFKEKGIPIIGELQYCFENCNSQCISVTGTNGKTTVTQLIDYILKENGKQSVLLGNGGVPFSQELNRLTSNDLVVLESSSFQLENFDSFAPWISVFTNLHLDHLDYHNSYAAYVEAKCNNFAHQTNDEYAIFNLDDENVVELSKRCAANKLFYSIKRQCNCYLENGIVYLNVNGNTTCFKAEFLKGVSAFNVSNILCAVLTCHLAGVNLSDAIATASKFSFDKHRYEHIACQDNVHFINDSKATNLHAALAAIENTAGEVCLILGGSDKGYDFDILFNNTGNYKFVAVIGETSDKILNAARKKGYDKIQKCENLEEAVWKCFSQLKDCGGTVLFSPACASFDMFKGYAERGEKFVRIVEDICSAERKQS